MSEEVTIKAVYRDEKETKFGPRTQTSMYVVEYPDVRMSSFGKGMDSWKPGDKVMVEITKNGKFTNFKAADTGTDTEARLKRLEAAVFGAAQVATAQKDIQIAHSDKDEPENFDDF